MISLIISRFIILTMGMLYPAYASYKAVRSKDVKLYIKWMMYWVVFALFTCAETVTDLFMAWIPFYYEFKVLFMLWLLSPATKGSSLLYRKFVHPLLVRRETEIDDCINRARDQSYHTMLQLGSRGVNYATNVIMMTAIKGGGGLVQQLRKSYSLGDLTEPDMGRGSTSSQIEHDDVARISQKSLLPGVNNPRSGNRRVNIYFPEVDVPRTPRESSTKFSHIRSSEDVSSGYSSAEPGGLGIRPEVLTRTSSVSSTRLRTKVKRTSTGTAAEAISSSFSTLPRIKKPSKKK